MRAVLEFTRYQWRAPEHADEGGDDDQCGTDELEQLVELAELDAHPWAAGVVDASGVRFGVDGVQVVQMPAGCDEHNRHRDQQAACNRCLGAKLTPAEPDHPTLPRRV